MIKGGIKGGLEGRSASSRLRQTLSLFLERILMPQSCLLILQTASALLLCLVAQPNKFAWLRQKQEQKGSRCLQYQQAGVWQRSHRFQQREHPLSFYTETAALKDKVYSDSCILLPVLNHAVSAWGSRLTLFATKRC